MSAQPSNSSTPVIIEQAPSVIPIVGATLGTAAVVGGLGSIAVKTKAIARFQHAFKKKVSKPYKPRRSYPMEFTRNPTFVQEQRVADLEGIQTREILRVKTNFAPIMGSSV